METQKRSARLLSKDVWNLKAPDVKTAWAHYIMMEFGKVQAKLGMPVTVQLGGPFNNAGNICIGIKHILCHICGEQNLNLPHWVKVPTKI